MNIHPLARKSLALGSVLLAFAVLNGAFGAHALKNILSPEKLITFETGIRYHFYHALALLIVGLIQQSFQDLKLNVTYYAFAVGIVLFSFNCYFYALTSVKVFAMVVPLGGLLFLVGWGTLAYRFLKLR